MIHDTVVEKPRALSKAELHAKLMRGLSRGIDKAGGKGRFADAIDLSPQALDKQFGGSMPSVEVLDRAFDQEPSVLDDWMRAKGKVIVDQDAVCDGDDLSVLLAKVALHLAEAEHPDGPGGRAIVPQEYLSGEEIMRRLNAMTARWLHRCAGIRGEAAPRMVGAAA